MSDARANGALPAGDNGNRGEPGLRFDELAELLPHRPPFVLIDRVISLEPGRSIRCVKNLTAAEPIFASHFPGRAIFPGAFLLEAMAQATLLLLHAALPVVGSGDAGRVPVLAAARIRWLKPVCPGDQLIITAAADKTTASAAVVQAHAAVDTALVARAQLTVATARLGH